MFKWPRRPGYPGDENHGPDWTLPFADRNQAGCLLGQAVAASLGKLPVKEGGSPPEGASGAIAASQPPLVLGIPRGGVVVAARVAEAIGGELDVVISRKVGAPRNPELAIGAVTPDGIALWNRRLLEDLRLDEESLAPLVEAEVKEISRRLSQYRSRPRPPQLSGRVLILVDDGLATGFTALAALRYLARQQPTRLLLAIPVAPGETVDFLRGEVDELICLATPEPFYAVGQFYRHFPQVTDAEVIQLLQR